MEKQSAIIETSFWVLGHRIDVLSYLFRFFDLFVPEKVRSEVLAPDLQYPQRVYGYQEMFTILEDEGLLSIRNPARPLSQFHAGEASALALAQEMNWWLLINEQRALTFARQHNIKAVTVPEFVVYLYHAHILSYNSALGKLDAIASNTGHYVMQVARQALLATAQNRDER